MSTRMHDLLEQAAGTPDMPVDVEAALQRGDRLRRRRQLAVGALAGVVIVGTAGVAMQLPGGIPVPEVAGQDDSEPGDAADDGGPLPDVEQHRDDLRDIAAGRLDDGRTWTARAAQTADHLCVTFSIADRELVDNCSGNGDRDRGIFAASLADRPGGANLTVGYVGGDWQAPVAVEFEDGRTTEADLYPIEGEGSSVRFFLAEHGDPTPTHLIAHDEHGEPQRVALHP